MGVSSDQGSPLFLLHRSWDLRQEGAQLVKYPPSMHTSLCSIPALHKWGMVVHTGNPSVWETRAGGSGFKVILGYTAKLRSPWST